MHWTSRKLLVVLLVSFPTALAARAGEIEMKAPVADSTIYTPTPLAEIFTGFAAAPGGYYGDFGAVFALRGDLDGDGLLIRLRGSGGSYSYNRTPTVRQSALYETGELMIGYRALIGSASLTGYIGPEIQHYANDDPGALVAGTKLGLKGEMQLYAPFAKQWYFFALGSFSVLAIDPSKYPQIGTVNYPQTLPLNDQEIVLTFDDGPVSPYTDRVLDVLAAECVKATFFIVGEMAQSAPRLVQRANREGHSIGTHTESHLHLPQLAFHSAKTQIEEGITSTIAALGDRKALAPFFRAPYLELSDRLEDYLASRRITVWSIDFQADDWKPISAEQVVALALKRIEPVRKGILLLHDIQPHSSVALAKLLRELKNQGYKIVHVVPAEPSTTTAGN
jgi:peptidoglycan/xylan/chitin deacetylase (PgdA/CDA1 family)